VRLEPDADGALAPALAQRLLERLALGGQRLERVGRELEDRRVDEDGPGQQRAVPAQRVEHDERAEVGAHPHRGRRVEAVDERREVLGLLGDRRALVGLGRAGVAVAAPVVGDLAARQPLEVPHRPVGRHAVHEHDGEARAGLLVGELDARALGHRHARRLRWGP
jgi:hypothetical protein